MSFKGGFQGGFAGGFSRGRQEWPRRVLGPPLIVGHSELEEIRKERERARKWREETLRLQEKNLEEIRRRQHNRMVERIDEHLGIDRIDLRQSGITARDKEIEWARRQKEKREGHEREARDKQFRAEANRQRKLEAHKRWLRWDRKWKRLVAKSEAESVRWREEMRVITPLLTRGEQTLEECGLDLPAEIQAPIVNLRWPEEEWITPSVYHGPWVTRRYWPQMWADTL